MPTKYDIRKSGHGYAIDKFEFEHWSFFAKFSTLTDAKNYLANLLNETNLLF